MRSCTPSAPVFLAVFVAVLGAPACLGAAVLEHDGLHGLHEDFKGIALAAAPPPVAKAAVAAAAVAEEEAATTTVPPDSDSALHCPREPYRPLVHYTPRALWMNDPNGLLYAGGEWHLFYQFNPESDVPANISWGHAVSEDLVRWRELTSPGNPAIAFDGDSELIFSGSAVLDQDNTSGLGTTENPPMVAIYTSANASKQAQSLAYSLDNGRTWTKYAGNPVLDEDQKEFRDPKVQWHAPTRRWLMAVALADDRKIRFYSSPDLKAWTKLSDFGPMGAVAGQYECPDLFPLPVDGDLTRIKWVLVVNVNPGGLHGGSSAQYFIGDFDGERFVPDDEDPASVRWLDFGKDYYAAVSWVGAPDGKRYMIGWMSNWQYAAKTPTSPWRNAMSVPRVMSLRSRADAPGGVDLVQEPLAALHTLAYHKQAPAEAAPRLHRNVTARTTPGLVADGCDGAFFLTTTVVLGADATGASLLVRGSKDGAAGTEVKWDADKGQLCVNRHQSGLSDFSADFPGVHCAPLNDTAVPGVLELTVLVDTGSVEVFAEGGRIAITDIIFPTESDQAVMVKAEGTADALVDFADLSIRTLTEYREECHIPLGVYTRPDTCRYVNPDEDTDDKN